MIDDAEAAERLTALWVDHRSAVAAFVARRAPSDMVDDVVSETFTVAWRKLEHIPEQPRAWLLGVARNVLATQLRSVPRWRALAVQPPAWEALSGISAEDLGLERVALMRAWERLSDGEREVLALAGWDGLTAEQAAIVLGCLRSTYSVRLTRARRHLAALAASSSAAGEASGGVHWTMAERSQP
jgi:RNA polymerase sigma-70 factor (ECF subfamily)